jgi:IS30 family transposase
VTQTEVDGTSEAEAIRRRDRDGETVREIARSYNVSHSTISRLTA